MAISSIAKATLANGIRKRACVWDEPEIGSSFGGGYYAGVIVEGGLAYYLIVAPKASGENSSKQWKTTSTAGPAAAVTLNNGPAASASMNSATYPASQFCEGLTIGGYTDWYLPSRDELELCYRNFKPDTTLNNTTTRAKSAYGYPENNDVAGDGRGVNRNSSPTGIAYTASVPAKTTTTAFKTGGTEAFAATAYWSSTEYSSANAWYQHFGNGAHDGSGKTASILVRAVRRVLAVPRYRVSTPSISTPLDLATSTGRTAAITAEAFSMTPVGAENHTSSDWQIATDVGFTTVVLSSVADATNKTSISPSLNSLAGNTAHYVRVRYNTATQTSSWSQPITFTTSVGAATPSVTSPSSGATEQSRTLTLTASAFSSDDLSSHVSSDWQVATDAGFTNVVWSSVGNTTGKTSVAISPALSYYTTYYVRVRYNSTTGASLWSPTVSFRTITSVNTPSVASPANGATAQSRMLTVSSSAFSSVDSSTHSSTDWQIASDSNFTTIVFQSLANATSKTSIQPTLNSLLGSTTYYVRVRYNSTTAVSLWSSTVSFTTSVGAAAPTISAPATGAVDRSCKPAITASAFSSNDSSTHVSSDWQISANSGFTSTVWTSTGDTTNKTSITVSSALAFNTTYYLRVRYNSTTGASLWSSTVTFTTVPNTLSYVLVAGGGGGGRGWGFADMNGANSGGGGGGGAGGYLEGSLTPSTGVAYTVTIGAGGPNSTKGSNSIFSTYTAIGGGHGAGSNTSPSGSNTGGSGGGATTTGGGGKGSGTAGQGFAGGDPYYSTGGGGGGASEAGNTDGQGQGGDGIASSITGASVTRAGGGGASSGGTSGGTSSPGGLGGGGAGGYGSLNGYAGTANTGGGGGGGAGKAYNPGGNYSWGYGGAGGSGVLILRYPDIYTATFSAGVTQTTAAYNGYKVSTITAAGASNTVTWN